MAHKPIRVSEKLHKEIKAESEKIGISMAAIITLMWKKYKEGEK